MSFKPGTRANPKKEMTDDQKRYLLEHYSYTKLDDMKEKLGVSQYKVICWLRELGVTSKEPVRKTIIGKEFFQHEDLATI